MAGCVSVYNSFPLFSHSHGNPCLPSHERAPTFSTDAASLFCNFSETILVGVLMSLPACEHGPAGTGNWCTHKPKQSAAGCSSSRTSRLESTQRWPLCRNPGKGEERGHHRPASRPHSPRKTQRRCPPYLPKSKLRKKRVAKCSPENQIRFSAYRSFSLNTVLNANFYFIKYAPGLPHFGSIADTRLCSCC